MSPVSPASLAAALASGLVLGGICFAGLWWTVRRGLSSGRAALWFGLSSLARSSVVLCGFYCMARVGPWSALTSLLGLLAARAAITRFTQGAL